MTNKVVAATGKRGFDCRCDVEGLGGVSVDVLGSSAHIRQDDLAPYPGKEHVTRRAPADLINLLDPLSLTLLYGYGRRGGTRTSRTEDHPGGQ